MQSVAVSAVRPKGRPGPRAGTPKPNAGWHAKVRQFWNSLGQSQQTVLWTPAVWESARLTFAMLDSVFKMSNPNAKLLSAAYAGLMELQVTESARRRGGVECEVRATPVKPPPASGSWSTDARRWWRALKSDPITRYYEPSDWWFAYFVCCELSRFYQLKSASAFLGEVLQTAQAALLLTPNERIRLEVDVTPPQTGPVVSVGQQVVAELAAQLAEEDDDDEIMDAEIVN